MKHTFGNASRQGLTRTAVRCLKTAVLVALSLLASSPVSRAQIVMSVDGAKQQKGAVDRDYEYGVWTSSGFKGSGFIQSNADQSLAFTSWTSTGGGFQANKGYMCAKGQMWYPTIEQMSYANGKGTATYDQVLWVRSADPKTQIWTGVQGWLLQLNKAQTYPNVEYYVVDNLDRGGAGIGPENKVGSVTIDGDNYDLYTRPFGPVGHQWRQWWSIRTSGRTSGSINYVKHFKAWQGLAPAGSGITNLVNNAAIKLPNMMMGFVVVGVETSGAADASIWWNKCTLTKPY